MLLRFFFEGPDFLGLRHTAHKITITVNERGAIEETVTVNVTVNVTVTVTVAEDRKKGGQ